MSTRSMGNLTLNVIANTGSFEEGLSRTERALEKTNKAVQRQKDSLDTLINKIDPVVSEISRLDKMQAQLTAHFNAGRLDDSSYQNYKNTLSQLQAELRETSSAFSVQKREFDALIHKIDPSIQKMAELDRMQDQLQAGFKSGLINEAEFNRLNATLAKSRAEFAGIHSQIQRNGVSAKQLSAAMRGMPAQFTDIVVSLQGGQNPLTVFLQQGGQIKDMFGGVGPAVKALGSYIAGLVSPVTVLAAGLSVLALAYYQGSSEADKFREALVFSGQASGETIDSLSKMAERLDAVSGTQRQAAAAIAEVTATGKFTSDTLERVSLAAVLMKNTVGKAVSDTVKEFEQLAKDPVKAVVELNDKYNFLTSAVYQQIVALHEQGQAQEAAQLAINAYADATEQRSKTMLDNLGYIEQAWRGVKSAATEAWDAALNVGRKDTLTEQLTALDALISERESKGPRKLRGKAVGGEDLTLLRERRTVLAEQLEAEAKAADEAEKRALSTQASIKAQQSLNQLMKEVQSTEEKRTAALKEFNSNLDKIREADPTNALLNPVNVQKGLAAIEEKFKSTKKVTDDAARTYLMQLSQQEAALKGQVGISQKLSDSQKQLLKFEQQIADIKEKKTLTAQQKSVLASELQIRSQLEKNIALEKEIGHHASINRLIAFRQNLQQETDTNAERYGDALAAFGMGDRQRSRIGERNDIERDVQRGRDKSTSDFASGLISKDEYDQQIRLLDEQLKTRLSMMDAYNAKEDEMRGDWTNGWKEAWANWSDSASDIASQTQQMFSNAFSSLEDALYDFVTTGNLNLTDMLRTMAEESIRMLMRVGAQKLANFAMEKTLNAAAGAGYVAQVTGQSTAGVMLAGLNAFASTAAIPVVGPALAPGAMATATSITSPLAAGAIAAATSSLAGMAHSGLDYIPREGTWLLDKGERVLSPRQNKDLTAFLRETPPPARQAASPKSLDVNFNLSALNNEGLVEMLLSNRAMIAGMLTQALEDQGVRLY